MKNSKNLLIAVFVLVALLVGFLLGISIDYPRFNQNQVTGTIGKVNNYRNTKVTEADIQLKNELATDTAKLRAVKNYFNFYYVSAVKVNDDVSFALKEANAAEAFKNTNKKQLAALKSYDDFLFTARTDLLIALTACNAVAEMDPAGLKNVLNQANNVISQLNYRKNVVLQYVDAVATFVNAAGPEEYQGLKESHDRLAINEMFTALITKDKVAIKFLDKTALLAKTKESLKCSVWDQQQLNGMIQQDIEKLNFLGNVVSDKEKLQSFYTDVEKLQMGLDAENLGDLGEPMKEALSSGFNIHDAEKLGVKDAEKLGWHDTEKLNGMVHSMETLGLLVMLNDAEKLGAVNDAEKLGTASRDAESLGLIDFFDTEKLGAVYQDANNLGAALALDAEKLGILDAEKLGGAILFNAEKLGAVDDAGKLGATDAEKLGFLSFN